MKWGMTDEQFSLLEKLVIHPLKDHDCQVYIFGSRANGTHHPHSDVDLLLKPRNNQNLPKGLLAEIKENIEESRFPFIVDLVNENELAESYRQNVFATRVEL